MSSKNSRHTYLHDQTENPAFLNIKSQYKKIGENGINLSSLFRNILSEDQSFFKVILIYGLFVSLLNLAIPVSVQLLINSVAYTAMLSPIIILGMVLLMVLSFSSALNALQFVACEILRCRFFARITAEIANKMLSARHSEFEKINQEQLTNRFFETFTVQKSLPKLLTQGFSLILQIFTGLILVTFYHPILLVFSIILTICLFLIWKCYYSKAVLSKFKVSYKKYEMAAWLEGIAANYIFFKAELAKKFAVKKTNELTHNYLQARKEHFKHLFAQVVWALILYSFASSALLMIGGYLVLKGQLSIGQLVASELVLSASFYGIYQLGKDLDDFYSLAAACEKLESFYRIPDQENGNFELGNKVAYFEFNNAIKEFGGEEFVFNFKLQAHKKYLVLSQNHFASKFLTEIVSGISKPEFASKIGEVRVNQFNIRDINSVDLNSRVSFIDDSPFFESTIAEYLTLGDESISTQKILDSLKITKLDQKLMKFDDDLLSLKINPSGWPLDICEKILLKATQAIIRGSEIIIISANFDILPKKEREDLLEFFIKQSPAMLIYFSNQTPEIDNFDQVILLTNSQKNQIMVK